jgi:acetyl-CoA acetyltransferase
VFGLSFTAVGVVVARREARPPRGWLLIAATLAVELERDDYGRLVVAQRRWAGLNPGAVDRASLTLDEYLGAPVVAEPLVRLDCVPVV